MKLLFDEIIKKPKAYVVTDVNWFPFDDVEANVPVIAKVTVARRGRESVVLKGSLKGKRKVACDRCSQLVEQTIASDFEYLVTTRTEEISDLHEVECKDNDILTIYLEDLEIDVDEILREQALLAVPLRTLCSEDCKGLCPRCGAVLSGDSCSCSFDNNRSPFAVLGKLCSNGK